MTPHHTHTHNERQREGDDFRSSVHSENDHDREGWVTLKKESKILSSIWDGRSQTYLGAFLLPSQAYWHRTESEIEKLQLKPAFRYEIPALIAAVSRTVPQQGSPLHKFLSSMKARLYLHNENVFPGWQIVGNQCIIQLNKESIGQIPTNLYGNSIY